MVLIHTKDLTFSNAHPSLVPPIGCLSISTVQFYVNQYAAIICKPFPASHPPPNPPTPKNLKWYSMPLG